MFIRYNSQVCIAFDKHLVAIFGLLVVGTLPLEYNHVFGAAIDPDFAVVGRRLGELSGAECLNIACFVPIAELDSARVFLLLTNYRDLHRQSFIQFQFYRHICRQILLEFFHYHIQLLQTKLCL